MLGGGNDLINEFSTIPLSLTIFLALLIGKFIFTLISYGCGVPGGFFLPMTDGVTVIDPANTYVDTTVTIGRDSILYPGTILEGDTVIGEGCHIGPYVRMLWDIPMRICRSR